MTLANFRSWNRCQVDKIQLVGLCFEHHIKKFSFEVIFEPIIND